MINTFFLSINQSVTNWNTRQPVKYSPRDIYPHLCTNIVYAFTVLDPENLTIQSSDTWTDIDNNYYEQVADFRQYGIKVTIAIGAWKESLGDEYERFLMNVTARHNFIASAIAFIEKYNFDGMDLDLEVS